MRFFRGVYGESKKISIDICYCINAGSGFCKTDFISGSSA